MKIIIFCILKSIFISTGFSQSNTPCHVCEYGGYDFEPKLDHPFSLSDLPERCDMVTFGIYNFVENNGENIPQYEQDAIKSLAAAGKPVYTYVQFSSDSRWHEVLDPKDNASYDKLVCPLIDKMKELQITGIILSIKNLYDSITDCDQKIKAFVTKIKEQLPDLKFGLDIVLVDSYKNVPNKELFDYSVTNSVIDLYFADLVVNFACTPELHKSGTVLTSSDKNVLSVELLSNIISQSTMDKAKIIACVNIAPLSTKSSEDYISLSEYCNATGATDSVDWCVDNLQRNYDIGAMVKKTFAGIAVDWIELDDVKCSCQCQAYPVTNTIFDGWDGVPLTPCQKLN